MIEEILMSVGAYAIGFIVGFLIIAWLGKD